MRLAFFLLVLGNLAFYVWSAGYLGQPESGREPERLSQQIAPDKIRIVGGDKVDEAKPAKPAKTAAADPARDCRRITGLGSEEIVALDKTLSSRTGVSITPQEAQPTIAHWVLIPRLPSRTAAEIKAAEVQRLGIRDFSVVGDQDSGPFVVSLGIFSADKGAQDHLAELKGKGVRSAVVEARERGAGKTVLEIRGPADSLQDLADLLPPQAGATLADCSPAKSE